MAMFTQVRPSSPLTSPVACGGLALVTEFLGEHRRSRPRFFSALPNKYHFQFVRATGANSDDDKTDNDAAATGNDLSLHGTPVRSLTYNHPTNSPSLSTVFAHSLIRGNGLFSTFH